MGELHSPSGLIVSSLDADAADGTQFIPERNVAFVRLHHFIQVYNMFIRDSTSNRSVLTILVLFTRVNATNS